MNRHDDGGSTRSMKYEIKEVRIGSLIGDTYCSPLMVRTCSTVRTYVLDEMRQDYGQDYQEPASEILVP